MAGNGVELVWDGKRKDVERVALPFQRVEIINESRATRDARTPMDRMMGEGPQLPPDPLWMGADSNTPWRNKLIWGDNKYVLASLLEGDESIGLEPLAGLVDLIYIDPPFATGADFSFSVNVGDLELTKEPSPIEIKAYRDTWGPSGEHYPSYLQMMYERLVLLKELLSPKGLIYVHCDRRVNFMLRGILDDLFLEDNLRNEIIWCYRGGGTPDNDFAEKHDTIFRYSKGADYYFDVDPVRIPYSEASTERLKHKARVFRGDKVYDKYKPNELGKHPEDWWTIQPLMPSEKQERIVEYPTQKPLELLQRIVESSCPPGGLVLDAFCGSGSTLIAADGVRVHRDAKNQKSIAKTGVPRRWIGCDLSKWAVGVARKRLLETAKANPFELLNLGRYQRRYWQGISVGQEASAYFRFIVELYQAEPVIGFAHLHGRKANVMVHVGATDAPVTISEVQAALEECRANGLTALDVLGWEWEMSLVRTEFEQLQRSTGVEARLFHIPHEVMDRRAVDKGEVHFYEAAYLRAETIIDGKDVRVELTDFIMYVDEYIRAKTEGKIKESFDWIDYWAVDFEYRGDVFHNQWQAYRTRKHPKLDRVTNEAHTYEKPGAYSVLVKVVDIFGNDTTALLEVAIE